eukprot:scaffold72313_cov26-Prasinocladus_malaysianus.AAC.1
MSAELIDEADAVGCWQNDRVAAVLFPTADSLERVRELCAPRREESGGRRTLGEGRLTIVINPQWRPSGQIISDFGFGQSRLDAEEFVEQFERVFCLRSLRLLGQLRQLAEVQKASSLDVCIDRISGRRGGT